MTDAGGRTLPADDVDRRQRRFPVGVEYVGSDASFRVWAPKRRKVELLIEGREPVELSPEAGGYFACSLPNIAPGTRYSYRLDGEGPFPDPASRFQPDGVHMPSAIVDPHAFQWTDSDWPGVPPAGQVIYELHIGTFTKEGTYAAAMEHVAELRELGVTVLEIMPLADFAGDFGWGYDGVDLFAPCRLYGEPDDLRRLIDRAHALGLGVILDVVYNHFGPDGAYLKQFSPGYFNTAYECDWGEAVNFDGADAAGSREFFIANAGYWIEEFHFDGLRLDATQQIYDNSPEHILTAISTEARRRAAAQGRTILLVAENEPQETRLVRSPERGGYGIDALWNDDLHHSAMVALTGRREAYYTDYLGDPQEFISAAKWGFLFQGQYYSWQKQPRGTPSIDLPPAAFVTFLENHDQVANSGYGRRLHAQTSPARLRALTSFMLLAPGTPMLFQGQEWGSSKPFLYFADHEPELAEQVEAGRREFLAQFPSLATSAMSAHLRPPGDRKTFEECKLDHAERSLGTHAAQLALHRDLLALRRNDPVIWRQQHERSLDGAVIGGAIALRFFDPAGNDRLLVVNLGSEAELTPVPLPLLAPPAGATWQLAFSSEAPAYGGNGALNPCTKHGWHIQAETAVLLEARTAEPDPSG